MAHSRILVAELVGTLILILGGPGTAILATGAFGVDVGVLGVALAFGLALLVAVYAVGPISGCHINPAVTLGLWLHKKVPSNTIPAYLIGQIVGAVLGGAILFVVAESVDGFEADDSNFAVNGWAALSPGGFDFAAMAFMEIVMTAVLVFVVLSSTGRGFHASQAGVAIGLTLGLIHLISIPVDNTSVNPVRSLATALFAGGDAMEQLWAFVVFPLGGAILGYAVWKVLEAAKESAAVATE